MSPRLEMTFLALIVSETRRPVHYYIEQAIKITKGAFHLYYQYSKAQHKIMCDRNPGEIRVLIVLNPSDD